MIGIFASAFLFAVLVIFSSKVKSSKQLKNNYSIHIIGELFNEKSNKNPFDRFLNSFLSKAYNLERSEMYKIIANNIVATAKSNNILIAFGKGVNNIDEIHKNVASQKKLDDFSVNCSTHDFYRAETLEKINNAETVILVVKNNKTSLEDLFDNINLINEYGKDFAGVIVI